MTEPVIAQKSPYVQECEPGTYWWCACGRSAKQPFCDGAHRGTGLAPLEPAVAVAGVQAWCGCKKTSTPPFCDGSHRKLGA